MKKIILFLSLSVATYAQQTNFPYGIKNPAATIEVSPTMITTHGPTNVYGKVSVNNLPVSIAVQDSLDKKLNISDLPSNLTLYPTTVTSDVSGYVVMVTDIHDVRYNTTAVNVSTPSITTTTQLVSSRISDAAVLVGQPGVFNATSFGNIRRLSGSGTATFYFEIYKRTAAGVETLIGISGNSAIVSSSSYLEFTASLVWDDGTFIATDRIVVKSYANRIVGGSDPVYQFQFGGLTPVRTVLPVPFSVVDAGYEIKDNKQNSLEVDGTGEKYPTVDAVNASTVNFNPKTTKIAFLGDSITYGYGSTDGMTSYADILNAQLSFQTYTKLGASSATVKPTGARPQLSTQVAAIPVGTNYITVMIGINDWAENNVIGDVNAVIAKTYASLDQTLSFAEAFRYNLETIRVNFPNAEIRVITPIKHDETWVRDLDFKFYVEAEIAIANFLSIPIINAYDGSGIYINSDSLIPDGIHPNDAGYLLLANYVKKGLINNSAYHNSNTSYNSLVVGRQELRSASGGETLRLTGAGHNGGFDNVGGFSLGLFYNGAGNRYAYFGGSDSNKKLIFNGNGIDSYDFSTSQYTDMLISTNGKRVSIGNVIGVGNLLNVSNYTQNPSNNILGIFGAVSQSGDYFAIEDVSSNPIFYVKANGNVKIGISPATSASTYDILTRNTSTGVVEKVLSNTIATVVSPAFTGTPTAPTATAGTNTTQIATTAFVLANSVSLSANNTFTGENTFSNHTILGAPIVLKSYTVATLPEGLQGDFAFVTDALAPTYMAAVVGGGAVVTPVFYNGATWVAH